MDDEKVQRHNATKLKWMLGGAASNWALKSPSQIDTGRRRDRFTPAEADRALLFRGSMNGELARFDAGSALRMWRNW
ncbi:hypothetical protein [Bradyrhizobium sp. LA7.1]|uniref:hypothetical protein n=1 Tax=Bradyrhizobium sp. LA7.1 TaxID=3156324 RepID=UPI003394788C